MSIGQTLSRVVVCSFLTVAAVGCAVGTTPLQKAARSGDLVAIRSQLKAGADPMGTDSQRVTALHTAAKYDQVDAVRLLLREGKIPVDVKDRDRQTPLHMACKDGNLESAKALILAGADIHAREEDKFTPLHFAARDGSVELCQYLIERGADPFVRANGEDDNMTPYDMAEDEGHDECADYLAEVMEKRGRGPHDRDRD